MFQVTKFVLIHYTSNRKLIHISNFGKSENKRHVAIPKTEQKSKIKIFPFPYDFPFYTTALRSASPTAFSHVTYQPTRVASPSPLLWLQGTHRPAHAFHVPVFTIPLVCGEAVSQSPLLLLCFPLWFHDSFNHLSPIRVDRTKFVLINHCKFSRTRSSHL